MARLLSTLVACTLLLCTLPLYTTADVSSTTHVPEDAWIASFTQLARSIVRLPFTDDGPEKPGEKALEMIRAYRQTPHGKSTEWSHRFGRMLIPLWEVRAFPNALEDMRKRPWFRESEHAQSYEPEPEEGEPNEYERERPKLFRPNFLHLLAARGFDKALKEVLSILPPGTHKSILSAGCTVSATLNLEELTPLHLLAIYATEGEDAGRKGKDIASLPNIATASLLISHGANLTAEALPDLMHLTPVILAGERGNLQLFKYFLSQIPKEYFLPSSELPRTSEEQSELDSWIYHRSEIIKRHKAEVESGERKHNESNWQDYMRWYSEQRPRTELEMELTRWSNALFQTLQLCVAGGRLEVVKTLLEGPGQGYGMVKRINERSHGGRGDTVIHAAIIRGSIPMVELLVSYGADLSVRSYDEKTPMQLALEYKQFEMREWLEGELKRMKPPPKSRKDPRQEVERVAAVQQELKSFAQELKEVEEREAAAAKSSSASSSSNKSPKRPKQRPPHVNRKARKKKEEKRKRKRAASNTEVPVPQTTNVHDEL